MWRKEIPYVIDAAIRAVIGAVITAAFAAGLVLIKLTEGSEEKEIQR